VFVVVDVIALSKARAMISKTLRNIYMSGIKEIILKGAAGALGNLCVVSAQGASADLNLCPMGST